MDGFCVGFLVGWVVEEVDMDDVTAEGRAEEMSALEAAVRVKAVTDVSGVMHSIGAIVLMVISAVITYNVASAASRVSLYARTFGASRSTMSGPPPMVIFLLLLALCAITMTLALFGVYRGLRGNSKWAVAIGLLAFWGDWLLLIFAATALGLESYF